MQQIVQDGIQHIKIHLISTVNKTQQLKCLPNIDVDLKDINLSHSKMKTNESREREKSNLRVILMF
jgi:hypothetical protein